MRIVVADVPDAIPNHSPQQSFGAAKAQIYLHPPKAIDIDPSHLRPLPPVAEEQPENPVDFAELVGEEESGEGGNPE